MIKINITIIALLLLIALEAHAASEWVYLYKEMDDKVIVLRNNGKVYQLEKNAGCPSLSGFEGKTVQVTSPGAFLGAGSELILPDVDQKCRIRSSTPLGSIEDFEKQNRQRTRQPPTKTCENGHWIQSVAENGETIKLENNSTWQVNSNDRAISSTWAPLSDITVCASYLINTDDGNTVTATRVK